MSDIALNVKANMALNSYNICETEDNKMVSISWTLSDLSTEEKVNLPTVGPELSSGCQSA